jgi:hypothetical protein
MTLSHGVRDAQVRYEREEIFDRKKGSKKKTPAVRPPV